MVSSSSQEGSGGADGIVLPLQLVGSGMYDAAYTLQVNIGNSKSFSLQVDTGSSDLWVAASSCSSSPCSSVGSNNLYNPSSSSTAAHTGTTFDISYLRGSVSGPIIWDRVDVGGYTINNQALAAATSVTDEALSSSFSGILGLALPLNSVIADVIPPVTGNNPDGAAWASNLFSLTPPSIPPASPFLSLSLSRPGSDRIPALFGIGHHPSSLVSDPSHVRYSPLVSDAAGTLYWKVSVRAISVYVDSQQKPINIGSSNSRTPFPTAVLDTGIPYILTTSHVADAIYGALGIGPGQDGNYYVPCTTPLNMSITLDDRPEIPLHPLDLTAEPINDNQSQYCVGMIQVANELSTSGIGDMVLGIPFLRSTYTVMAYTVPYDNGSFPDPSNNALDGQIHPRLGLLALTDPQIAMDEFHTVRVLNQPMTSSGNNSSNKSPSSSSSSSKKLSDGLVVLLGLIGFFSLCFVLFGLRWFLLKRRFRSGANGVEAAASGGDNKGGGEKVLLAASKLKPLPNPPSTAGSTIDSEKKFSLAYSPLGLFSPSFEDVRLEGTIAPTTEGDEEGDKEVPEEEEEEEEDIIRPRHRVPVPVPVRGVTFPTQRIDSQYTTSSGKTYYYYSDQSDFGSGGKKRGVNESFGSKWSVGEDTLSGGPHHERNPSLSAPLLTHQHHRSHSFGSLSPERTLDMLEFGYRLLPRGGGGVREDGHGEEGKRGDGRRSQETDSMSMAGIGSAARAQGRLETLPFPRTKSTTSASAESVEVWMPAEFLPLPPTTVEDEDEGPRLPRILTCPLPPLPPIPPSPLPLTSSPLPLTSSPLPLTSSPLQLTSSPLPPIPPTPISPQQQSSGYHTPSSWLDEFDPYLETT